MHDAFIALHQRYFKLCLNYTVWSNQANFRGWRSLIKRQNKWQPTGKFRVKLWTATIPRWFCVPAVEKLDGARRAGPTRGHEGVTYQFRISSPLLWSALRHWPSWEVRRVAAKENRQLLVDGTFAAPRRSPRVCCQLQKLTVQIVAKCTHPIRFVKTEHEFNTKIKRVQKKLVVKWLTFVFVSVWHSIINCQTVDDKRHLFCE